MTSKEAWENIKESKVLQKLYEEEVVIIDELVERDTPKKVCYDNVGRSECPNCDKSYLYNGHMNRNKYCGYCGQRLDWSE